MNDRLYCANHPKVETRLRCNKCGKPICPKCAVRTPVGYRCRECVNSQQRVFYAGFRPSDYLVAAVVAVPLSLFGGWLVPRLGWYTLLLGPVVGGGIAEAVLWAVKRRRGRYTWAVVCGSVLLGALPTLAPPLVALAGILAGAAGVWRYSAGGLFFRLLWLGIYLLTATGAAYVRLRTGRRI